MGILNFHQHLSFRWKKGPFSHLFLLGNIDQENVFYHNLQRKNVFIGYKNNKFKKSKNWHFSQQVNPWFSSKKWPFFQLFFRQYRPGKCFLRYSRTKNAFLAYKNKKFKKSINWDFSKGVNPWFWFKNGRFSNLFFLGNICQENVFYDILERKNAFLGYKNNKFKKSKNWHFS